MGQHGNRLVLAGLILFLGGIAVGGLGARLLAVTPPVEPEQRPLAPQRVANEPAANPAELTQAIEDLRMTLVGLQTYLERAPRQAAAAPTSTRVPVGDSVTPPGDSDLAASMNALAKALQSSRSGSGSTGSSGLVPPGWVDRRVAFATKEVRDTIRRDNWGDASDAAVAALRSNHMFWSKQEILTRYGTPDDIHGGDTFVYWEYSVESGEEYEHFTFRFDADAVVGLDYDYGWDDE